MLALPAVRSGGLFKKVYDASKTRFRAWQAVR